jgi:uncharacterized membrane protein
MAAGAAGSSPNASAYAPPPPGTVAASGLEPHVAGALCYTPFAIGLVASIIFLLVAPFNQNKFVRFNAFQSLFLHLGIFLLGVVMAIIFPILLAILHVFALIFSPVPLLLWLGVLVLLLFMMFKTFNNQQVRLPIIGALADKQA